VEESGVANGGDVEDDADGAMLGEASQQGVRRNVEGGAAVLKNNEHGAANSDHEEYQLPKTEAH
jgi:hypothetical protein